MIDVEAIRQRYRPKPITTLFIGESAPHNETFFYLGENSMLRQMRLVMEAWKGETLGDSERFLKTFQAHGWYLDDLVLRPVNQMLSAERTIQCRDAEEGLAMRIRRYKPQAIVILLKRIVPFVARAAKAAECEARQCSVPFPGNGNQVRFRSRMAEIIGSLPKAEQISN